MPEAEKFWNFTSSQIQDGGRCPNCTYWNRNNSAADCSISLKFGEDFDHVTTDTLQTFKVKGSKVKVTAWRIVSAASVKRWERIGWHTSHLLNIITVWSATCDSCSRSLGQILKSPLIARFRSNLVQSLTSIQVSRPQPCPFFLFNTQTLMSQTAERRPAKSISDLVPGQTRKIHWEISSQLP